MYRSMFARPLIAVAMVVASVLCAAAQRSLTPTRVRGTIAAIERELMIDGLVLRYRTRADIDGLPAGEGVFLPCSFWLANNYKLQNRDAEAFALFDRLLSLRNDVGLLAEEYDPQARRQLGNFPQAFSHLSLVNSASNLGHFRKPVEQRSQTRVGDKTAEPVPAE